MKLQAIVVLGCTLVLCATFPNVSSQGTGKVQEFFKKYFGEYFPKTTRSYTLVSFQINKLKQISVTKYKISKTFI